MKAMALVAMSALLSLAATAAAQAGYGTSSISLGAQSGTLNLSSGNYSLTLNYTVSLASGNTWGTTLEVQNQAYLDQNNISVYISNPSGDPPYGGNVTITAFPSTVPGIYNVTFIATGDDPSAPVPFSLSVAGTAAPAGGAGASNSMATSSTICMLPNIPTGCTWISTANASSPCAGHVSCPAAQGQREGNPNGGGVALYLSMAAVVVMIAVIALAFRYA